MFVAFIVLVAILGVIVKVKLLFFSGSTGGGKATPPGYGPYPAYPAPPGYPVATVTGAVPAAAAGVAPPIVQAQPVPAPSGLPVQQPSPAALSPAAPTGGRRARGGHFACAFAHASGWGGLREKSPPFPPKSPPDVSPQKLHQTHKH